jgi:hypothetical protein
VTTYRETTSRYMHLISLNSQSFTFFLRKFTKRHKPYSLIILIVSNIRFYHKLEFLIIDYLLLKFPEQFRQVLKGTGKWKKTSFICFCTILRNMIVPHTKIKSIACVAFYDTMNGTWERDMKCSLRRISFTEHMT